MEWPDCTRISWTGEVKTDSQGTHGLPIYAIWFQSNVSTEKPRPLRYLMKIFQKKVLAHLDLCLTQRSGLLSDVPLGE